MGGPEDKLDPPFLAPALGEVQAAAQYGCVLRSGYYFRVHLPAEHPGDESPVGAVYEAPTGGAGMQTVDPSLGELYWGIYAWPAEATEQPRHAYFINQDGSLAKRFSLDGRNPYVGLQGGPEFDAALSSTSRGDMRSPVAFAAMGLHANDGGLWTQVGN